MDCSLPGSSVHGIFQAGILEWLLCPLPGDIPDPGIEPESPALQVDSLPLSHQGSPSLVVQWLKLHLPKQRVPVWYLVWEIRSYMLQSEAKIFQIIIKFKNLFQWLLWKLLHVNQKTQMIELCPLFVLRCPSNEQLCSYQKLPTIILLDPCFWIYSTITLTHALIFLSGEISPGII